MPAADKGLEIKERKRLLLSPAAAGDKPNEDKTDIL